MTQRSNEQWFGAYDRYSINRFRPLLLAIEVMLCVIGCLFWVNSWIGYPSFTPWTYGDLAYSIPVKFWAAGIMGGSAMCVIGLIKPVKKWMVIVGSALLAVQFSVLAYSAIYTGGEFVIGIFSSNFFLTFHLWLLIEATRGN